MVEVAARLLAQGDTLTARRLCSEIGSSTITVYTRFGSMGGVVRAIVHDGFARLADMLAQVGRTSDPVADLALYGRVYRHAALTNAHLFAVMFGRGAGRVERRYAMGRVVECVSRCVAAGRFREVDAGLCAHQLWISVHGLVMLENGGYVAGGLAEHLVSLLVGAGDSFESASESVRVSGERFGALHSPGNG